MGEGGDLASGFFPGKYSDVADQFTCRVSNQFVSSQQGDRNVTICIHLLESTNKAM